jgi:hypothetical protein
MRRSRLFFVALALAAATAVDAQRIGRYVFPDGRVVYSDQPVPGAKLVDELAPPPPASAPAPSREGKAGAPSDRPGVDRAARLREANAELQSATQALERARAQLDAGIEPLPGERTGTIGGKGGGSRLNEAYDARQEANQKAVADAEERLKRAVAARNAAQF